MIIVATVLALGDPLRDYKVYLDNFKGNATHFRMKLIYPWERLGHPGFDLIWKDGALSDYDEAKLDYLCEILAYGKKLRLEGIVTPLDSLGIIDISAGWLSNPLNVANGGFLDKGGNEGIIELYESHRDKTVEILNKVIERVAEFNPIIEPMNKNRGIHGNLWAADIAKRIDTKGLRLLYSSADYPALVPEGYDLYSYHRMCDVFSIINCIYPLRSGKTIISTDECEHKELSGFQGRTGHKELVLMLATCNPADFGIEMMFKQAELFGVFSEDDKNCLKEMGNYVPKVKPERKKSPKGKRRKRKVKK